MSEFQTRRLDSFIADGSVLLGRGDIISKEDIEAHPGPYPIYSSSAQGNGKFGEYGKFMFDEELITWSVDGGGNFFYREKHRYSVTNVCGYMRIKSARLNPKFVFYSLANQHRYKTFDYTTKAHPSVIQKLYWLPTIRSERQQKIASILTGIDTAIEKTEVLIAKYQQIKAGLMHDLFTRGVLPNGQLRPPRQQAPELYQETAIGWIPREWRVSKLEDVCKSIVDCPHSTPNFQPGGVLVARTMHIKNGVFLEHEASFVSEREYQERVARAEPLAGDVVFTREAPVGEAFVIPKGMRICLGQRVMLIKPNSAALESDYLVAQIYSGSLSTRIAELTAGTTNPHLNVADVRTLLMALPPFQEQAELKIRINAMNARLHSEERTLRKLQQQKSGLMHDLLTGKVPVKVEEAEAVNG